MLFTTLHHPSCPYAPTPGGAQDFVPTEADRNHESVDKTVGAKKTPERL